MNTYADIRNTFFQLVNDAPAANVHFTTDQAELWANTALRDMAQASGYADAVLTTPLSPGFETYALGEMRGLWRVEIKTSGIYRHLAQTTKSRLYDDFHSFTEISGEPRNFYSDATRIDDDVRVGFFPKPDSTYYYRFFSQATPTAVDNGSLSAEVDVPHWCVGAVLYYMLYQAYRADTKIRDKRKSDMYKGLYSIHLDSLIGRTRGKLRDVLKPHGRRSRRRFSSQLPETITGT